MRVICVDMSRLALIRLKYSVRRIVPTAKIYTCQTSETAFQIANKKGCDVLLTEFNVSNRFASGYDLAKRIKEINPRLNIVFITECFGHEVFSRVFDVRASGYVKKPYDTQALLNEFQDLRYPVGVNISSSGRAANTRMHAASAATTWRKKLRQLREGISK